MNLLLIVDPQTRSLEACDHEGAHHTIGAVDAYVPPGFPDLVLH